MKKSLASLLKKTETSGIYFDFDKNRPYIQYFKSPTSENDKEVAYSYSVTFWLSQILMGVVSILGIILDGFVHFPVFLSIIFSLTLGGATGKILVKIIILKFIGRSEYIEIEKQDIVQIISKGKEFWILRLTEIFLYWGIILVSMICLSQGLFSGKDFIMFIIAAFSVTALHDIAQPKLMLKARKILKNQLKEGKFDD